MPGLGSRQEVRRVFGAGRGLYCSGENLREGRAMDRYIARENIKHFRDRLWSEIDQDVRARLQQLLVAEEDKLAANLTRISHTPVGFYGQLRRSG
jgi:hypothetical protein